MRIKVNFKAEQNKFPLSYRMMISSVIKKSLEISDEEYFKNMYYYEEKKNKRIKPFTFSVFFKDYKIDKGEVNLNGQGSIIISTPDYNFGIILYNGLLRLRVYDYKEYKINIQKVLLEKEKTINEDEILCRTLSPIYIRTNDNKTVTIDEINKFNAELNYIANIAIETYSGRGLEEELKFTPVKMKKVVAKEKITDFKLLNNKEFLYIEGYAGTFKLEGSIEDLKLLKQLGLGFRRSEGFGLFDLV
ncbi:CRISPR-associated protein Cas6 [Clostridium sp. DL-VIII]|uniref:CRISPR-associated endoribonuclease Cas6 n=1 Tax=Clostridium sp. DL-VIII TaxID=641107 RepID=UPI00023B0886|nr:CRISPR-associated endoribonuclease Cas6 [Clostridium sp. DL-VIII]EHJ01151.1 CRISPR-associated protein Cas6 [Clostridium sp. DL-VIII]